MTMVFFLGCYLSGSISLSQLLLGSIAAADSWSIRLCNELLEKYLGYAETRFS
jgi:hypothetical protein